jgi:GH15 family glucan-1,4-alpha-glucosidase
MGGSEGAFSLCTLWAIEALARCVSRSRLILGGVWADHRSTLLRAGVYDKDLLTRANDMLTDFLGYGNHVGLFSEEISISGEGLGNTPQGFSAVVRPFHFLSLRLVVS